MLHSIAKDNQLALQNNRTGSHPSRQCVHVPSPTLSPTLDVTVSLDNWEDGASAPLALCSSPALQWVAPPPIFLAQGCTEFATFSSVIARLHTCSRSAPRLNAVSLPGDWSAGSGLFKTTWETRVTATAPLLPSLLARGAAAPSPRPLPPLRVSHTQWLWESSPFSAFV